MKKDIKVVQVLSEPKTVMEIVRVYQETFGGDPWNEGYKCPKCDKQFPYFPKPEVCSDCLKEKGWRIQVVECWPTAQVASDLFKEMSKPDAICLTVKNGTKFVVGFVWGYRVTVSPQLDTYLAAPKLHKLIRGDFFYLDEVALMPSEQGKGLGKLLAKEIFAMQKVGDIILRTKENSRMSKMIINMGGSVILKISNGRVIMKLARTKIVPIWYGNTGCRPEL